MHPVHLSTLLSSITGLLGRAKCALIPRSCSPHKKRSCWDLYFSSYRCFISRNWSIGFVLGDISAVILQSCFCQRKICNRKEEKKSEPGEVGNRFLSTTVFIFWAFSSYWRWVWVYLRDLCCSEDMILNSSSAEIGKIFLFFIQS